jgi:hypothetical protein
MNCRAMRILIVGTCFTIGTGFTSNTKYRIAKTQPIPKANDKIRKSQETVRILFDTKDGLNFAPMEKTFLVKIGNFQVENRLFFQEK